MMDGYKLEHIDDEAGRFYGVRIEQEVVQLTREEFKNVCARISVLRRDNAELRVLVRDMLDELELRDRDGFGYHASYFEHKAMALGIEVS